MTSGRVFWPFVAKRMPETETQPLVPMASLLAMMRPLVSTSTRADLAWLLTLKIRRFEGRAPAGRLASVPKLLPRRRPSTVTSPLSSMLYDAVP